jgi:hypothetical protein
MGRALPDQLKSFWKSWVRVAQWLGNFSARFTDRSLRRCAASVWYHVRLFTRSSSRKNPCQVAESLASNHQHFVGSQLI